MEFLTEYGLFLAKTITFVAAIVVIITVAVSVGGRNKKSDKGHIEVTKLNEHIEAHALCRAVCIVFRVEKQGHLGNEHCEEGHERVSTEEHNRRHESK